MRTILILIAAVSATACTQSSENLLPELPPGIQAISLLGDTLYPPEASTEVRKRQEQQLAEARAEYDANPDAADAIIWLGRRTAYLGQYREAVRIFTEAIERHPDDARTYRHRGHRFITLRMFDRAIADFERAAELTAEQEDQVEPDGQPNERNIPTGTLQTNIWYHLGLAHYLKGKFDNALLAYRECLQRSGNPDMLVATSHWLYMTLRRLGRASEAAEVLQPIHADLDVIENHSYHRLLLMYKGEILPDSLLGMDEEPIQNATLSYGVANWLYYNGSQTPAERIFRDIIRGPGWPAFGFIAAEAQVNAMR